ncbi:MAG: hypothetical protein KAS32_25545 [Candidatus Peribacteraceae bacterium]|nr:hypothetical protein [Candidatus Peribacteraceae bacterium]
MDNTRTDFDQEHANPKGVTFGQFLVENAIDKVRHGSGTAKGKRGLKNRSGKDRFDNTVIL